MDPRPAARLARSEGGFVTPQVLAAVGLSLVLLVAVVNLVAFQYGRGVVRAALDEGARVGARAGAGPSECAQRARAVLADLLGGRMGEDVTVTCRRRPDRLEAVAQVRFAGWLPLVPDWRFTTSAAAALEPDP